MKIISFLFALVILYSLPFSQQTIPPISNMTDSLVHPELGDKITLQLHLTKMIVHQ